MMFCETLGLSSVKLFLDLYASALDVVWQVSGDVREWPDDATDDGSYGCASSGYS